MDLFIDIAAWVILLLVGLAIYDTYKWRQWALFYQSKTILYLYRSAFVKTAVSVPMAGLAAYRVAAGPDAPPVPYSGLIIVIALIALIGNLTLTTFSFRELDSPLSRRQGTEGETQNQKEDRAFGDARRGLEDQHIRDRADANSGE